MRHRFARQAEASPHREKPSEFPQRAPPRGEARLADDLQILGRTLAVTALDEFVLHALTLAQAVVASPLDRGDVHERVGTAIASSFI